MGECQSMITPMSPRPAAQCERKAAAGQSTVAANERVAHSRNRSAWRLARLDFMLDFLARRGSGSPDPTGGKDVRDQVPRDWCFSCGRVVGLSGERRAEASAASSEHDLFRHQQRVGQGRRPWRLGRGRSSLPDPGAGSRGGRQDLARLSEHQATGGAQVVNARDRIGLGPWQNFKGEAVAQNADDLHSDNNKLGMQTSLTERGTTVAGVGYTPNYHDVLTGSQTDGRAFPPGEDRTCRNWTTSTQGAAMVGRIHRMGLLHDAASTSWHSS